MQPTEEQTSILALGSAERSNLMINAYAGTGKTSTLEMLEKVVKEKPILYLVFNARNAKEAEKRMQSTTTVRTFNSLGHRIWGKTQGKNLVLDKKKSTTILRGIIDEVPKKDEKDMIWDVFWDVIDAVGRAKALGYVPEGKFPHAKRLIGQADFHLSLEQRPDDFISDLVDAVLTRSIKMAYEGIIDYNDQIYMPAMFGGVFPQFPLVLVDEYQDLNPTNHVLIEKLTKGRRLIGVGDRHQNIYQFRGAKAAGMDDAQAKFSMKPMDLSISFRCPTEIVKHVQWHVPKFQAFKEGGHVEVLDRLDPADISPSATFICRNNAPLFSCALKLLSHGHGISVAGSDIGPKLVGIMKKLGPEDCSRQALLDLIAEWEFAKLEKESTTAHDLAECMRVFARTGANKAQAIAYAEHLFKQEGSIQLLTGHKAKGLEWDTVYHLDPSLCGDSQADRNLRYVISTRSKDRLFEINSSQIAW